jgi:ABC-type multidrug transport system ATPase subunit
MPLVPQSAAHRPNGPVVLRASGIEKAFGGQVVLDGISLELRRGEVVLLRGGNGSGKTTLLNVLTGYLEPDSGTIELLANGTPQVFSFPRRRWRRFWPGTRFAPERVAAERVSRMWQDLRLFGTQSLRENVSVAFGRQLGENPVWALLRPVAVRRQEKDQLARADAALAELGLVGRGSSSADMVSLGQAKRVAIARAVAAGAEVLLLDEPLSGLDSAGVSAVMDLLGELARSDGVTLIVVEHVLNTKLVLAMADTVWTLTGGKLTAESAATVRGRSESTQAHGDLAQRLARPASKTAQHQLPAEARLTVLTPPGSETAPPVLEIEDLVVKRGHRIVIGWPQSGRVHGVSFLLRKGEVGLLEAPNGWGKTTLLEALAGLVPVARGSLRLNGIPIQSLPAWHRAQLHMSFLQSRSDLFPGLTVAEGLRLAGVSSVPSSVEPLMSKSMSALSGGERRRVAIACLGLGRAELALLDEPFSSLDEHGVSGLWNVLSNLQSAVLLAEPIGLGGSTSRKGEEC